MKQIIAIKQKVASFILACVLLLGLTSNAMAAKTPDEVARETFDNVVSQIQANRGVYEKDSAALYDMLEEYLLPSLNLGFMVDLILGKELATSTPASQHKELVDEFKVLLLRTYASGILYATGDDEVVYEKVDLAPDAYRADLNVKLVTANGGDFPIKLKMTTRNGRWSKEDSGQWRAYNLIVAGQNIARLYRATFARTLKEQGVEGLINNLRTKNTS